jgi:thiosulfate/3-mercaptopyruvate sulfurtransferase
VTVVDAVWLREHGDDVVVADVRWYLDGRSGRDAYEAGHIPGAVFVDLDGALAAPVGQGPGRHPLPTPEVFAAALAEVGIGDGAVVVAYDDAGGSIAARLWWMLDAQDQTAHVLDGGLAAWDSQLVTGPEVRPAVSPMPVRPWRGVVDADGAAGAAALLDARAPERYRGDVEPVDPRAGHIPGAVSAPWSANLDPSTGRFLAPADLRARYEPLGAEPVVYCGSGVTACHDLLAIRHAGLPDGRLYEGSWSDWSSDPARPAATGAVP